MIFISIKKNMHPTHQRGYISDLNKKYIGSPNDPNEIKNNLTQYTSSRVYSDDLLTINDNYLFTRNKVKLFFPCEVRKRIVRLLR